jgi:hypothetical protein
LSAPAPNAGGESIPALINELCDAVFAVTSILQEARITELESGVLRVEALNERLSNYPGGSDALRNQINQLEEPTRNAIRAKLESTRQQHDLNQSLIKLDIQRNVALQSYSAQTNLSATYSSDGGVPLAGSNNLLGKV